MNKERCGIIELNLDCTLLGRIMEVGSRSHYMGT